MTASYAYAAATVTSLGFLSGDNYSFASGISADASVVIGTSGLQPYVGFGSYQAFRWTASSGMVGLGHLPGDTFSSGNAANGDGSVVVGQSFSSYAAFRWSAGSTIESLPIEGGSGVSADGNTIVGRGEQSDGRAEALIANITGLIAVRPGLSINLYFVLLF